MHTNTIIKQGMESITTLRTIIEYDTDSLFVANNKVYSKSSLFGKIVALFSSSQNNQHEACKKHFITTQQHFLNDVIAICRHQWQKHGELILKNSPQLKKELSCSRATIIKLGSHISWLIQPDDIAAFHEICKKINRVYLQIVQNSFLTSELRQELIYFSRARALCALEGYIQRALPYDAIRAYYAHEQLSSIHLEDLQIFVDDINKASKFLSAGLVHAALLYIRQLLTLSNQSASEKDTSLVGELAQFLTDLGCTLFLQLDQSQSRFIKTIDSALKTDTTMKEIFSSEKACFYSNSTFTQNSFFIPRNMVQLNRMSALIPYASSLIKPLTFTTIDPFFRFAYTNQVVDSSLTSYTWMSKKDSTILPMDYERLTALVNVCNTMYTKNIQPIRFDLDELLFVETNARKFEIHSLYAIVEKQGTKKFTFHEVEDFLYLTCKNAYHIPAHAIETNQMYKSNQAEFFLDLIKMVFKQKQVDMNALSKKHSITDSETLKRAQANIIFSKNLYKDVKKAIRQILPEVHCYKELSIHAIASIIDKYKCISNLEYILVEDCIKQAKEIWEKAN